MKFKIVEKMMSALDEENCSNFRLAMRRMAASVGIVSVEQEGERFGMTLTAVTSYSMNPPSIVFCVNRDASIHSVLAARKSGRFCLNLIAHGQEAISNVFSSSAHRTTRFEHGQWEAMEDGVPYLKLAQSNLICSIHSMHTIFTHSIFVATVDEVIIGDEFKSLIYCNGGYLDLN